MTERQVFHGADGKAIMLDPANATTFCVIEADIIANPNIWISSGVPCSQ